MAGERLDMEPALGQMAEAMAANCEKALDGGGPLHPSLMLWYDGDDLARPGAVVEFEQLAEARDRLDLFTRTAIAWALAYDALVSADGESSAAVMIEAELRDPPTHAVLARRYRPRAPGRPFAWSGDVTRLPSAAE